MPPEVERIGSGEPIVFVHGGAPPENTWPEQRALAERWTVVIPTRRGYHEPVAMRAPDFNARLEAFLPSDGG